MPATINSTVPKIDQATAANTSGYGISPTSGNAVT